MIVDNPEQWIRHTTDGNKFQFLLFLNFFYLKWRKIGSRKLTFQ